MLNIYKVSCSSAWGAFDSFVCAAANEHEARHTHPDGVSVWDGQDWVREDSSESTWLDHPATVKVVLVGVATLGSTRGVILASRIA